MVPKSKPNRTLDQAWEHCLQVDQSKSSENIVWLLCLGP